MNDCGGLCQGGYMPIELAGSLMRDEVLAMSVQSRAVCSRAGLLGYRSIAAAGFAVLATLTSLTVPSPASAQTPGLVAAYAFNDGSGTTVADMSGNNNNGTISAATWTTAGRFGNALVFNGTSARVTVPDAASLQLTTGMTLEAWVFPTATPTDWRGLAGQTLGRHFLMASPHQGGGPSARGTWVGGNQHTHAPSVAERD